MMLVSYIFFYKQKTAYEMRISDWSSDVCSSDLDPQEGVLVWPDLHACGGGGHGLGVGPHRLVCGVGRGAVGDEVLVDLRGDLDRARRLSHAATLRLYGAAMRHDPLAPASRRSTGAPRRWVTSACNAGSSPRCRATPHQSTAAT